MARTEIGAQKVETQNYSYTLQGWIKGVQGQNFSYALGYNSNDYRGIGANSLLPTPIANNAEGKTTGLFNGNIATWSTNTPALSVKDVATMTNQYTYDQLNRIKTSNALNMGNQYRSSYSYDANGNITDLQRYTGTKDKNLNIITPQLMDNFHYNYEDKRSGYQANTNKLRSVDDAVKGQLSPTLKAEDLSAEDLEDQDIDNYQYDDIGNLSLDRQEEIDKIEWNAYGKVKAVCRKNNSAKANLVYAYDASGNRVSKTAIKGSEVSKTYYVRDASGNVMSTYTNTGTGSLITLGELYLYGSNRLGMDNGTDYLFLSQNTDNQQ